MDDVRNTKRYQDPAAAAEKQPRRSNRSGGSGGSKKSRSRRGVNNSRSAVSTRLIDDNRAVDEDTSIEDYGQAQRSSEGDQEAREYHYLPSSSAQPKVFQPAALDASAYSIAGINPQVAGERRIAGAKSTSRRVFTRSENEAVEGEGGASKGIAERRFDGTGPGYRRMVPPPDVGQVARAEYGREGDGDRAILEK